MTTEPKPESKSKFMRMLPSIIVVFPMIAVVAGVSLSMMLNKPAPRPELSESVFYFPATRAVPEFQLTDHNGAVFDVDALKGKWSFLFFGYTHCPDICPTTLHSMAQMIQALGEDAAKTQFVFISVDPERDTVERLASYIPFFSPHILGVTGTPEKLEAFAQGMWVPFLRVENPESPEDYVMDHSTSILVIDPHARYHAIVSPPYTVDGVVENWRKMSTYFETAR